MPAAARAMPAAARAPAKATPRASAKARPKALPKASPKAARAKQAGQKRARGGGLEPAAVLRCTEKAMNAALLIQERCRVCHGQAVRDVLGAMVSDGNRYTMADLRYDIKHGRLEVLPPGGDAGAVPAGKARADAPLAGQPLPAATVDEFFTFLQCQLRMELREHTGKHLELADKEAERIWPDVEAFITPNLGATERWVPYHTVLGVHELFLVQHVHSQKAWNEKDRFKAMFIFRAHCKRDLFNKAQLPIMLDKAFWKDPAASFAPGGPMEKAILKYRKATGQPLITSCFRIIPPRVLKDDDENLVRSITKRSISLLQVADMAWGVIKDIKKTTSEKLNIISSYVQAAQGLGETWAKMLTVCIDLAYPKEMLLESQCDVGNGAAPPLKCLAPTKAYKDKQEALTALLDVVNSSKSAHARNFWKALKHQEGLIRAQFGSPLIRSQADTQERKMSAATLQVQLCEYRQYRHSIARHKYGLPDDESMRGEIEKTTRLVPENFVEFDDKRKRCAFTLPRENGKIEVEVPYKLVGNSRMVAYRAVSLCFEQVRTGSTQKEATSLRDELVNGYVGGDDVPDSSEAWQECRCQVSHMSPVVSFYAPAKDGKRFPFQTTQKAANGSMLEAERIARLCWNRIQKGASKPAALAFRDAEYSKLVGAHAKGVRTPAKKQRTA